MSNSLIADKYMSWINEEMSKLVKLYNYKGCSSSDKSELYIKYTTLRMAQEYFYQLCHEAGNSEI